MKPQSVIVRRSDYRIRANDICRASDRPPKTEIPKIKRALTGNFDTVQGSNHAGTYVDFWDGVKLCKGYGLIELEKKLRNWKTTQQEPEFIEITDFASPVVVQMSDFRINAAHIINLTGHSRGIGADLRDRLDSKAYDILRGSRKYQGTYVNFSIGIELCREHGLLELEKRLHSLKQTSKRPMIAAELGHARSRSQTPGSLPGSIGLERASAQTAQSTGIRIRDQQPLAPSGGPIIHGSMHAGHPHGLDSGSDVSKSEDSVISREPCSTQRKSQPVPSIRCAKDAASSRQSGRNTTHSLELADPHSHSAKSAQYELWDSRPQLSELTEVKPDLGPSTSETPPHYGSFSDLFAPI